MVRKPGKHQIIFEINRVTTVTIIIIGHCVSQNLFFGYRRLLLYSFHEPLCETIFGRRTFIARTYIHKCISVCICSLTFAVIPAIINSYYYYHYYYYYCYYYYCYYYYYYYYYYYCNLRRVTCNLQPANYTIRRKKELLRNREMFCKEC